VIDKTAKPDKWQGIEKLADEATVIAAHNWHRPLTEIRERIEAELRRALEPLLEAAEGLANHSGVGMRGVVRFARMQEELRKEIDTWRKR